MFKFIFVLILWIFLFGLFFLSGVFIGWKFNEKVTGIVAWVRSGFKR